MSVFVNQLDEGFMELAVALADDAAKEGEVPVGAVIVREGKVIATGRNRRETLGNSLAHAEIEAINNACKAVGGWRLTGCTLYVTLEPCPMCAGAIVNARIDRVVYGAKDIKAGSAGSLFNLFELPYNHKPLVNSGVLNDRCSAQLEEFFKDLR